MQVHSNIITLVNEFYTNCPSVRTYVYTVNVASSYLRCLSMLTAVVISYKRYTWLNLI